MNLTYDDPRSGDTYEIELDAAGAFLSALRYVSDIGRDPIHYSRLAQIPTPHKEAIEQKIWQATRRS